MRTPRSLPHPGVIASALAIALFALPASTTLAQEEVQIEGFPPGVTSCVELREHYCGDVKNRVKYKKCLRKHRSEFPPFCLSDAANKPAPEEDVAAANQPDFGAIWANCGDAIDEYCSEVEPGGGNLVACLSQNRVSLEPECADVVPDTPAPSEEAAPTSDEGAAEEAEQETEPAPEE